MLLTAYLGTIEISQGLAIDRKVTLASRAVADLASQLSTITNADMTNILNGSAAVKAPFDPSKLKVVVTGVKIDGNGVATVAWSDTLNGAVRAVGSTVSLPAPFKVNNSTVVLGEVSYEYKSAIGYVVTGPINLTDHVFMRSRASEITRLNS